MTIAATPLRRRHQMTVRPCTLGELLPVDHGARTVCAVIAAA